MKFCCLCTSLCHHTQAPTYCCLAHTLPVLGIASGSRSYDHGMLAADPIIMGFSLFVPVTLTHNKSQSVLCRNIAQRPSTLQYSKLASDLLSEVTSINLSQFRSCCKYHKSSHSAKALVNLPVKYVCKPYLQSLPHHPTPVDCFKIFFVNDKVFF